MPKKGFKPTEKTRKKLSDAKKGKKPNNYFMFSEIQKKAWKSNTGSKHTEEHKRKISESHKGDKCYLWKGGINPENDTIRKGIEFRLWREAVFSRDSWTCQKYKIRDCKLHPHHIQNFAEYPELRFAIDNGITLSEKAHWEFHKKYGKHNNNKEQMEEFLNAE